VTIFGAVLGDAAGFVVPADHEAGDVLEEDQWDAALVAQLNEVGALLGGLAEQHAIVGDDSDRMPVQMGEPCDERGAVLALELVELAAVDEPRDHFVHVVLPLHVGGNGAVQLASSATGIDARQHSPTLGLPVSAGC
jgi:hypothetical protein